MNTNKLTYKAQVVILTILAVLVMFSPSWAATYYVDATNGVNNNDGLSPTTAWKTIAKINNLKFNPGDQILFKRGGIWRDQLVVSSSGSGGNPITFGAYGSGDKPIINGADLVTNWSQHLGNVYKAPLSTECHRVFHSITELTEDNGNKNNLGNNEWDWDSNYLYVNIGKDPAGETIEAAQRDYCLGTWGAVRTCVTVDGLHLKYNNHVSRGVLHGAYGNCKNWTVQNCIIEYSCGRGASMQGDDITFNKNIVRYNKSTGVGAYAWAWTGGSYTHNTVYENGGGGGFDVAIQNATFSHNVIHTNPIQEKGDGAPQHGFYVYNYNDGGNGCIFEYNEVYGFDDPADGDSSIRLSADNCIVRYNHFHDNHVGMCLSDPEDSCDGNKICYNIFENVSDHYYGIAGAGCTNCEIYNNVFDGAGLCFVAGEHGDCSGNKVKNNIIYGGPNAAMILVNANQETGFESDYNCFYPTSGTRFIWLGTHYNFAIWKTNSSQDAHSIHVDPEFHTNTPEVREDFRLSSTSPCINTGSNVGLIKDIAGTSMPQGPMPDIGCFEYVQVINPPSPPKNLRIE